MRCAFATGALLLALSAGCGGGSASGQRAAAGASTTAGTEAATSTSSTAVTTTSAPRLVNGKPHFETPEDAMRYLAAAWNANDIVSLKHVTDPSARDQLNAMHGVAVNLQLKRCEPRAGAGDFTCTFSHDFPPRPSTTVPEDTSKPGEAVFLVGPADAPGWYMTVFESCG
jgi:hypothetical protein